MEVRLQNQILFNSTTIVSSKKEDYENFKVANEYCWQQPKPVNYFSFFNIFLLMFFVKINQHKCIPKMECSKWLLMSNWSDCSVNCGQGIKKRKVKN